jgi:hypothetical protein
MNKQKVLELARTAGSICAVLAGLWVYSGGHVVNHEMTNLIRYIFDIPPIAVTAEKPVPAPTPVPTPATPKESKSEPVASAMPQRDWVDLTDKYVDWFTKIVGSLTALLGVVGLTRQRKEVT